MFSQTFQFQDAAGFVTDQATITSSASDLSVPTLNIAGLNSNMRSSSSTAESSTTINGKTTSIRIANNLIQVRSDFTSDGVSDLVQFNRTDGVAQLFVNQSEAIGTPIDLPAVPTNWDFSGLADGDGNGVPDIYWTDAATGQSTVWLSTGSTTPPFYYRTEPTGTPIVTMPAAPALDLDLQSRIQSIFGRIFQR
jgi:hypothetical protein